jgi:AcrR family transcriptional regulator
VVLEAAVEEIDAKGAAAVSLREIARRAGVSHAAPAHHFHDKAGVLSAVAAEGYRRLAAATGEAQAAGGDMTTVGLAYVRFAFANRAHFEVMFRPELYRPDEPEVAAAREEATQVLFDSVRGALGEGASEEDVWGGVVAAWSFTHGFATLWLEHNFYAELGDDGEAVALLAARSVSLLADAGAFPRR